MKKMTNKIKAKYPDIKKPYDKKIRMFPCRSFNMGLQTATFFYVDHQDLAHF
jgi:hypothetical protein